MRKLIFALSLVFALPAVAAPCSDTEWLNKAYGDLLFRPPTQQELSAWIDANSHLLANGASRFDVAWAIASSNEGTRYLLGLYPNTVAGYFQAVLGRAPSDDEFNAFWSVLDFPHGNAPDFEVLALIIGGKVGAFSYPDQFDAYADAQNPGLTACTPNRSVVNQIFQVYMGRNATTPEIDFWTAQLVGGTPLQTVALGISGVPDLAVGQQTGEYYNRVVRDAFTRFYRRAPSPDELVNWSLALSGGTGLNEQLWAVLMSDPQYCTGVFQTSIAKTPPPPAAVVQLQANVAGQPQVYSVGQPLQPSQVADGIQVFSVQQHVIAQNAVIAQLSGNVVPCPPDRICISATSVAPATPGDVIIDLTAQVGSLNAQVLQQGSTISQQQQLIARQQSTIVSLVDAEFGLPVNLADATAARAVAKQQIDTAAASAKTRSQLLALNHARLKFAAGDEALTEGELDQALRDYKDAFRDAQRAMQ